MAPKFALFTKGSNLPLNKGFKNMFELLQSCAQPSILYRPFFVANQYVLRNKSLGPKQEYSLWRLDVTFAQAYRNTIWFSPRVVSILGAYANS